MRKGAIGVLWVRGGICNSRKEGNREKKRIEGELEEIKSRRLT
jgi:hypothetical protein